MKSQNAKTGHFYKLDTQTFLVGRSDSVKESIHVWFYSYANGEFYLYDKHLYYGKEIKKLKQKI